MKMVVVLLVTVALWMTACAIPGLRQDCLARQQRAQRVATIAAQELKPGWTAQEVHSALGEPDEVVAARGLGEFDIWKYYLLADCQAQIGLSAPETDLFFLGGNLVRWTTFEPSSP
jgi:hypothetical protein